MNEAEIPAIIYRTFSRLGLKRFQIRVNNRKILNGFYALQGLQDKSGEVMRTVDKLDKIGPDKVRSILVEDTGVAPEAADEVCAAIRAEIASLYDEACAQEVRVLYGGSMKPANANLFLPMENIDGGLIGGAALKADSFTDLVKAAIAHAG